jgi:hypothetical protein
MAAGGRGRLPGMKIYSQVAVFGVGALALLFGLYAGAYLIVVEPSTIERGWRGGDGYAASYRLWGSALPLEEFWDVVFAPANEIDRRLRPGIWSNGMWRRL